MTDAPHEPRQHHSLRERLDAAEAAAEEVVAEESGQMVGEVSGLVLPFEQAAAAVRAAIHPGRLAEHETVHRAGADGDDDAPVGAEADAADR